MDSDIGQHWYLLSSHLCGTRDYLPLLCQSCSSFFCRDHIHAHSCAVQEDPAPSSTAYQLCDFCTKVRLGQCERCSKAFCVQHRVHGCEEHTSPAVHPTVQPQRPKHKMPEKPKNPALAEKLQRMLIRKRATGDEGIPEPNRVALHFEVSEGSYATDVFVADFQVLGVALDLVARKAGVPSRGLRARKPTGEVLDLCSTVAAQLQSGDTVVIER